MRAHAIGLAIACALPGIGLAQAIDAMRPVIIGDSLSIEIPSAWPYWPRDAVALPPAGEPVRVPFDWADVARRGPSGHYRLLTSHDTPRLSNATQGVDLRWDVRTQFTEAQLRAAAAGEALAVQALARYAQAEVDKLSGFRILKDARLVSASARLRGSLVCSHVVIRYTVVSDGVASETHNVHCPDGDREIQLTVWAAPIDAASGAVSMRIAESLRR